VLCALTSVVTQLAQAQAFTVLHTFTGGNDGANPFGSLTLDRAGNIYGTASAGGYKGQACSPAGCGTVYQLKHRGSSWTFTSLYSFRGVSSGNGDGATPYAGVTVGPNGVLYGTTIFGGYGGVGTVFSLQPAARASANALGGWQETVLYRFVAVTNDGNYPAYGNLVLDPGGNFYGTTYQGGSACGDSACGTVFQLTPRQGGGFTESLYDFPGRSGGGNPLAGVILDGAGNLYGTTSNNNYPPVAYELSPSGAGWNETTLYIFPNLSVPQGGVTFDGSGGLFGTTADNFESSGNTVYQLSPSGGQWAYSLLYTFPGSNGQIGPWNGVVRDASGNLYGTTFSGGAYGAGSVFKLTPSAGGWIETDLYDFTGGRDGASPVGGIVLDANGTIYGTTASGGAFLYGVVWEITP